MHELYLYASLVFFLIRKHLMAQSILAISSELMDVDDATLWSFVIEIFFLDIMVEEVNNGNIRDEIFTQKIWTKIHEDLKRKNNQNYSIKQVKHKFNRFHTKHREFSELLKQIGFDWDAETNFVNATEEMWENYLRVNILKL